MLSFDDFIPILGEFGPYQRRVLLYACILVIPTGSHIFAQVFLAARTEHWCSTPPQWKDQNCTQFSSTSECDAAKKNVLIPPGSTCSRYDYDFDSVDFSPDLNATDYTNVTSGCRDGWTYDRSQYTKTIIQDYDLVCDKKALPDMAQSIFAAGFLTGAFVFGSLSDWLGRQIGTFIGIGCTAVFGTLVAFAPNFAVYCALRFLVAASVMGLYFVAFICATEYVGPSKRTLVGVLMADAFAVGYMLIAVLAYFIRDWQTLQLVISVPCFLLLGFIPLFPESARWLLTRGNIRKAKPILEKAAACGKVKIPESLYDEGDIIKIKNPVEDVENEGEKAPSCMDILRYPNVRWRTLNMMFNWFVNNMVYYGISLSTASLGGNEFIAAFLSAAVEIPAYTTSLFVIEKWGRRVPLCVYLVVGGVSCIATIWIPLGAWRITIAMIGKFSLSSSYGVVYIYAAELFPTPVRSMGLGACCMCSHLSGIVTPMILSAGLVVWAPLPLLIFGTMALAAGGLALLFPETKGEPLQETMEESEAFGKKKKHDVEQKPLSKIQDGVGYDRISMQDIDEEKRLSNGGKDDSDVEKVGDVSNGGTDHNLNV